MNSIASHFGVPLSHLMHPIALASLLVLSGLPASHVWAQTDQEPEAITVSVTRLAIRQQDTPASLDVRSKADIERAGAQINLSESLAGVPGLVANNRGNYAQDIQLSTRGFGARTAFGVRGVRVLVDGIPGNSPDGQGQVSHVDLSSARQIEVLRGPFSALYGNSSGGVILVSSEQGGKESLSTTNLSLGSAGSQRLAQKFSGTAGAVNYVLSASQFQTDGWREHSAAKKTQANARLGFALGTDTQAVLTANTVRLPNAQDPQGVTAAGLATPQSVPAAVLQFDTRKSTEQTQFGVDLQHKLNAQNSLKLMAYNGSRAITQFQSIATAAQTAATSAGGVVDLDRGYHGIETRWTWSAPLAHGPLLVHLGAALDRMNEDRRGYENFIGTSLGVQGKLRRDESNRLASDNYYAQVQWWALPSTALHAGWRSNRIRLHSQDKYIATGNPDDSGSVNYSGSTPVLGLMHQVQPNVSLYASYGRGFDSPTMNEIAYNPNSALSGLNLALTPARSRQSEVGVKWAIAPRSQLNLAYFDAITSDEIVVLSNSTGRSRFQNAGRTSRRGFELSLDSKLSSAWQTRFALSNLDAKYMDSFKSCYLTTCSPTGTGANAPRTVAAGAQLPGVGRVSGYGELLWRSSPGAATGGMEASLDWRASSKVAVDDLNSEYAAGYSLIGARLAWRQTVGNWKFAQSIRVDNLANKRYVGSVIVNQASSQFYEPGQGRSGMASLTAVYQF